MNYDAIVIGGGIVGTSTAYHLICNGAKTLLIDRRDAGRATDAGAGILSPATHAKHNASNTRDPDPWLRLAAFAFEYYPQLVDNLQAEQDGDTGFATCGMMLVAVSYDEMEPFAIARRHIFNPPRINAVNQLRTICTRFHRTRRAGAFPRWRMYTVLFTTAMPPVWMVGFYRLLCTGLRRRRVSRLNTLVLIGC